MAASGGYRSSEQLRSLKFPSGVTPDPRLKMSEDWTGVLHGERRSWSIGTINKTEIRKQVRCHVRGWGIVFRVVSLPTRDKISRDAVLSHNRVINHPWHLPQISLRMVIPAVAGGRVGNVQIRWRFAIDFPPSDFTILRVWVRASVDPSVTVCPTTQKQGRKIPLDSGF